MWTVINLRTVVNIEDVDYSTALVNPVNDAVGAAPGTVTACERPKQGLPEGGSELPPAGDKVARQLTAAQLCAGGGLDMRQAGEAGNERYRNCQREPR